MKFKRRNIIISKRARNYEIVVIKVLKFPKSNTIVKKHGKIPSSSPQASPLSVI